jgi:hypothetical protein
MTILAMSTGHQQLATQLQQDATQLVARLQQELRHGRGSVNQQQWFNAALHTLVQISLWLPEHYYARVAVTKLNLVVPLLLRPQSATSLEKLLTHCQRLLQELDADPLATLRRWVLTTFTRWQQRERLLAMHPTLPPCAPIMYWLHTVQSGTTKAAMATTELAQLTQLQQWSQHWQQLEQGSAAQQVQQQIDKRLDSLLDWLRQPAAVAEVAQANALAAQCQQILALLDWVQDSKQQQGFAQLALYLLAQALQQQDIRQAQHVPFWQAWWRFRWQRQITLWQHSTAVARPLLQAFAEDWQQYQHVLAELSQRSPQDALSMPSLQPLVAHHYALPWSLAVVQQPQLSLLYHVWYRYLVLHSQYRQALTPRSWQLLQTSAALLAPERWATLAATEVLSQLLALLSTWPTVAQAPVQSVVLQRDGSGHSEVAIAQVPLLLASKLQLLSALRPSVFATRATFAAQQQALMAELRFLERGSAAVRVYPIERLCILLLELYQAVAQQADAAEFPGALLWQVHVHLLDLLDEAAAWQDPQLNSAVLQLAQAWLASQHSSTQANTSAAQTALAMRWQTYVQQLALTLELTVRFSVECQAPLSPLCERACELSVQQLLRLILLEHAAALEQRRLQHKPSALSVQVNMRQLAMGVQLCLEDDGSQAVPSAKALQRLQRKLPSEVVSLQCLPLPLEGRRFQLLLPA